MAELAVTSISIEEVLTKLRSREWLIPQFQRDFVWSITDVIAFTNSILFSRPIGMATVWTQPDDSGMELEPLSVLDRNESGAPFERQFCAALQNPNKTYAVLDGRQRCHAVAMAFGGFHSRDARFRLSGRFFLDVTKQDPGEQVRFIKESDVRKRGYDKDATCVSEGLFPLSSNIDGESVLAQWMRYIQLIRNAEFYVDGILPDAKELDRRDAILKRAFDGIIRTKLAVYIVPESYGLAEICEIFETLNTTGTQVSTVDLIHSWLYSDTRNDPEGQVLLRDWISDLGQKDGAIGWASSQDRPELIVQTATACYVALENKVKPRRIGAFGKARKDHEISSVKADDLLATPTEHWRNVMSNDAVLAEFIGDFQRVVADGLFPWTDCPYPISSAIYVALRFHAFLDPPETHQWGREDLNAIFRAFFWRNALTKRYDQGFLTKLGADIRSIKGWLNMRPQFNSSTQWAQEIDSLLAKQFSALPDRAELVDCLTDELPPGAMGKALTLPMKARAETDLLGFDVSFGSPPGSGSVQMHHIYPKAWCQTNKTGELAILLDKTKADRDWVNSVANLMPLSRQANNIWKNKVPGQVIIERSITYEQAKKVLRASFVDEEAFNSLTEGAKQIRMFWESRADAIASDLIRRMKFAI